jgi:hypothetical protein
MFGIKPKLMNCRFELTYFYDLLTYFKTIIAKVVMFGIKPKLTKCRHRNTGCSDVHVLSEGLYFACNINFCMSALKQHLRVTHTRF